MVSFLVATLVGQTTSVFPYASERVRPDGTTDVVFIKDSRDKGVLLGKGSLVTLIPRQGGCAFVTSDKPAKAVAFDSEGKKLNEYSKLGYSTAGRPAIDPTGSFMVVEFVGEFESEIWRIPLRGMSPAVMLTSINKGAGTANPAFEMDSRLVWLRLGGAWNILDTTTSLTNRVDVKPLLDGLPSGSTVTEVKPSHSIPKQVAVTIQLPGDEKLSWVMAWDRQTNLVSRLNPVGTSASSVDWTRDGRYIFFKATDTESGRQTLQAASPSGGRATIVSVIRDPDK